HGRDVPVGFHSPIIAQHEARYPAAADLDKFDTLLKLDAHAVSFQPALQLDAIQPAERNLRDLDFEAARMPHKAVEKHLAGVAGADAVAGFIESAGENQAPEA